jgi:hypothetical protein
LLNRIRFLRNRIFHHEPIWHWKDLGQQHKKIPQLLEYVEKLDPNVTSDPAYLQLKDKALKNKYDEYFYAVEGARCDMQLLIKSTKDVGHNMLEIELFPAHLLYPRM